MLKGCVVVKTLMLFSSNDSGVELYAELKAAPACVVEEPHSFLWIAPRDVDGELVGLAVIPKGGSAELDVPDGEVGVRVRVLSDDMFEVVSDAFSALPGAMKAVLDGYEGVLVVKQGFTGDITHPAYWKVVMLPKSEFVWW